MRQLKKKEEDNMRNILDVKTGIQVPLHLMYLDLQYFLQQNDSSLLHIAPQKEPVRRD